MLSQALSLHQQGEFTKARELYQGILDKEPDNHEALHLMGALALQTGDPATAEALIAKAIAIHPEAGIYYGNRANALRQLNRAEAALTCLEQAIAIHPQYAESHYNKGILLAEQKRHAEAITAFDQAIALQPKHAEAHYNKGNALLQQKEFRSAIASYEAAIALRPNYSKAYYNKGNALRELKEDEAAVACFTRAIALQPNYAKAYYNRGNALQSLKRHAEAVSDYDHCITLRPDDDMALVNKGNALLSQQQYVPALHAYDKAIEANPAVAAYHNNKGNAYLGLHQTGSALDAYGRAIQVDPLEKDAHFNQAICYLLTGDLQRGFAEYEWRWQTEDMAKQAPRFPQPRWRGQEPLQGKRILVHCEQGLGDTIQFVRYAKRLGELGAHVILVVQPPLMELMKRLDGSGELIADGSPLPSFDYHCPLLSLPLAFGTRLDTIPSPSRYIFPEQEKIEAWQRKLGPRTRPRIGLAWSGRPEHKNDENRSLALAGFLKALPDGLDLVCLQKELRERDRAVLAARPDIRFFGAELKDFSDTAALCEAMDLVVSVDTSVAHLAGALGKPTWILLPFVPDWRWLLDREDSPWYPSVRLFRQPRAGDWDSVLHALRAGLTGAHAQPGHREQVAAYRATAVPSREEAELHFRQALSHRKRGDNEAAVQSYDRALALDPAFARASFNRGNALIDLGRLENAVASYRQAIAHEPGAADAHFNLGTALLALDRALEAIDAFDHALALKPDSVDTLVNKGNALRDLGRDLEAITVYERAIALAPERTEARNNKASALLRLNRAGDAAACFEQALAVSPGDAGLHLGRANALRRLGRLDAALESFERVLAVGPDNIEARNARSLCLLLNGDLRRGFAEYEWRWRSEDLAGSAPRFAQPLWLGREDIRGKRLLLRWEQGLGDTIQFCRYAKVLSERGAQVILVVQPPLLGLLTRLDGQGELLAEGSPLPPFDYYCPLLSLPLACGTELSNIPAAPRYIHPDPRKLEQWRTRLGPRTRPRIGIAWSGRAEHRNDEQRSMALADFLQALPDGFETVVLQKDVRESDRATLAARSDIRFLGDELKDFSDTAALCELMDLVISVDTSVAHLAGALGKPLWILLPFVPDWRWMMGRTDSPWYPGARLFRQQEAGRWAPVLARVKTALQGLATQGFRMALAGEMAGERAGDL